MMEVRKGAEYDYHTDSIYDIPECPNCETPLFGLCRDDIETTIRCQCCGAEVYVPNEDWIREYLDMNNEERTVVKKCMKCGGRMTAKEYMLAGKWQTLCGICQDCGMSFIV